MAQQSEQTSLYTVVGSQEDIDQTTTNKKQVPSKYNKRTISFCVTAVFLMFAVFAALLFCIIFFIFFEKSDAPTPVPTPSINCMNDRNLVIVSLDGFANFYFNEEYNISTPNIDYYFKQNGVYSTPGLKATFPTKTYSSHYSIVTGMYPAFHGIAANKFYDPVLKEFYSSSLYKADFTGKWYKGEPIWNTAKLVDINSGTFYFPGSLANCSGRYQNISGYAAYHYDEYVYDWLFMDQINKSIELMTSSDTLYNLILLYMYQPDFYGHVYGPNSVEVKLQIQKIDFEIGLFMDMLKYNNLFNLTDIIIVSDHGMTEVEIWDDNRTIKDESKQIIIDSTVFPFGDIEYFIVDICILFVYLFENQNISEYINLMNAAIMNNFDEYKIYENGNMPYNFNNGYNHRVPDIMVESSIGYTFYVEINGTEYSNYRSIGNHGYNNSQNDMYGIWLATGPSFKSNYQIDHEIESVDLYPLFCKLLCNVEPNPNANGSIDSIKEALL